MSEKANDVTAAPAILTPEELDRKRRAIWLEENARTKREIEAERVESNCFLQDIRDYADEQIRLWGGVACGGLLELVTECTDAYAATCGLRDHVMCARRQAEYERQKRIAERAKMREQFSAWGVPPKVLRLVWDGTPAQTEAVQAIARAFASERRPSLVVLSGAIGCGKTVAAVVWALEAGARFITSPDLGKTSPYDDEADWIMRAKALVIDDLGTEYLDGKGFFLANLDALINHRYAHELPTLITTNLLPDDFRKYGERTLRRIREDGVFVSVGSGSVLPKP